MEISRILRYEVPVDDKTHTLMLGGPIVHVGTRDPAIVEIWAVDTGTTRMPCEFTVVGTGHEYPEGWQHVGSAITAGGALVWHLLERRADGAV